MTILDNLIWYDFEVFKDNWIGVFFEEKTKNWKIFNGENHEAKIQLRNYLSINQDKYFVGFNNKNFDNVVIEFINHNKNPWKIIENFGTKKWQYWKEFDKTNIRNLKFNSIDLIKEISAKNLGDGEEIQNLKEIELNMGNKVWEKEWEQESQNWSVMSQEQRDSIIEYCKYDVKETRAYGIAREKEEAFIENKINLVKYFKEKHNRQCKTIWSDTQIISYGLKTNDWTPEEEYQVKLPESIKAICYEDIWNHFQNKILTQKTKLEFKKKFGDGTADILLGGIHYQNPKPIWEANEHHAILDIDATSFYIFLLANPHNEELRYHSRAISNWQYIYEKLLERIKAKKDGDTITANALKTILVKIFGASGMNFTGEKSIGDWPMARMVCIVGQLILTSINKMLDDNKIVYNIIQMNTDGQTIQILKKDIEKVKQILEENTKITGMRWEIDENWKKIYQKTVNNYLWVHKNGKVKGKGYQVIGENPSYKKCMHPIVSKMVKEKLANNTPFAKTCDDLIKARPLDWWYWFSIVCVRKKGSYTACYHGNQKIVGKSHRIFVTADKNFGKLTKMKDGTLCNFADVGENHILWDEDIYEMPKELIDKIDISWYLNKAEKWYKDYLSANKK